MRNRPGIAAACITALALVGAGCGRQLSPTALGNQPPQVQFTAFDVSAGTMTAAWSGFDPDGRVDRYLVTEDLRAVARGFEGWTPVIETRRAVALRRPGLAAGTGAGEAVSREPRVLAVRAVDDRGEISSAATRAWFDDNVAPTVQIVSPRPSQLLIPTVPSRVTIHWEAEDPDGPGNRPESFRYRLIGEDDPEFPLLVALVDPDSLRRFYAPDFPGWTEVPGQVTEVTLDSLTINSRYLFVITAIDRRGDYDPVFSLDKNMLYMTVGGDDSFLSTLVLVSDLFRQPLLPVEDTSVLRLEVPANWSFDLHWETLGPFAASHLEYRWALDLADLQDAQRRHGPHDLSHWSAWTPTDEPFSLGSFTGLEPGGTTHRAYVDVRDPGVLVVRTTLEFRVVRPTFNRDLLIVDDMRLVPDYVLSSTRPDTLRAPSGDWPTAAELDTFLFAVGGVRWRMTPPGTLSPRGIFAGYSLDTLGTRNGLEVPTLAASLSLLSEYRHIVWIVDQHSAAMAASPTSVISPSTLLRWACSPGRSLPLRAYVDAGGSLWALGGGFGLATNAPWDFAGNNVGGVVFSSLGSNPDLVPGRFMYDLVHWRSEFVVTQSRADYARAPAPSPPSPFDYSRLPDALRLKTAATDPIYPFRIASSFYQPALEVEYLRLPNVIGVDTQPSPRHERIVPTLDTLMNVRLFAQETWYPIMTHYRGADNGPVVFSGHNIWNFRREDCERLVDAVLGGIWGLQKSVGTVATAGGTESGESSRRRR